MNFKNSFKIEINCHFLKKMSIFNNELIECNICFCEINDDSKIKQLSNSNECENLIGLSSLLQFQESYDVCITPCCKKIFHIKCLDKWFKEKITCPMCRNRIRISNHDMIFCNYKNPNYESYPSQLIQIGNYFINLPPYQTIFNPSLQTIFIRSEQKKKELKD